MRRQQTKVFVIFLLMRRNLTFFPTVHNFWLATALIFFLISVDSVHCWRPKRVLSSQPQGIYSASVFWQFWIIYFSLYVYSLVIGQCIYRGKCLSFDYVCRSAACSSSKCNFFVLQGNWFHQSTMLMTQVKQIQLRKIKSRERSVSGTKKTK